MPKATPLPAEPCQGQVQLCVCACVNKEEAGSGRALLSLILNTQISASHDLIQKLSKSLFPPQRHSSTFHAPLALCPSPPSLITSSFVSLTFLVLIAFLHSLHLFLFSVSLQSLPQYIHANVSTVLHLYLYMMGLSMVMRVTHPVTVVKYIKRKKTDTNRASIILVFSPRRAWVWKTHLKPLLCRHIIM